MPATIQFEWSETQFSISFEFDAPGLCAKNCDVFLSEYYVKVNCPPKLNEIDLAHAVDYCHAKTRCRFSKGKLHLELQKVKDGLWTTFKADGTKEELKARREASIQQATESAQKLSEDRATKQLDLLKKGESDQWRLDRENRETVENWQKEEKKIAEDDVYESLRSMESKTVDLGPSAKIVDLDEGSDKIVDLDEGSEQVPEILPPARAVPSVRGTENFVLPFTKHARPGVPARDLPGRAPPHPRGVAPKPDMPEEMDPVWLKDKGDTFLTQGDYLAANNAYTEALKEYSNARCFANRAVCALYLGNLGQCIEDSNHALATLKLKTKVPEGQCPPPQDPEDAVLESALHIRCGVGNLWLGHFARAIECFDAGLKGEGLRKEEKRIIKEDKQRIINASKAMESKTEGDLVVRRAGDHPHASAYDDAIAMDADSGVLYANRCFIKLQTGDVHGALEDGNAALERLAQWPIARLPPPKLPARPQRLDPPTIEDHLFRPQVRKGEEEKEWLMKHSGGTTQDLPPLPPEYEWIRDASEKSDDAWIAVKKKLSRDVVETMRRNIGHLQDSLFTRKVDVIQEAIKKATEQNVDGVGPCAKAIRQAEEYAGKLEEYYRAQEEKLKDEEGLYAEEVSHQGRHTSKHSVEKTRRRLYVKVKLRRAAAYEALRLQGDDDDRYRRNAIAELEDAIAFEPSNADALDRLQRLLPKNSRLEDRSGSSSSFVDITSLPAAQHSGHSELDCRIDAYRASESIVTDDEDEAADCASLLESARGYITKEDYGGAFQILSYALRKDQFQDAADKIKCMSNACLCLQKMRGRTEDLVAMCTRTLGVISDMNKNEAITRMECACYSRRGWGYSQMGRTSDAAKDAERVQYLLQCVQVA